MTARQLECRIVLTFPRSGSGPTAVGMYDPMSGRYEPLGAHGPGDIDRVVADLATSIQRAGHRLTWCERSV